MLNLGIEISSALVYLVNAISSFVGILMIKYPETLKNFRWQ